MVFTIDASSIKYYIDGQLFGTHDAKYLPERPMGIYFNQWLIDLAGQTGTEARAYDQQVDYVLHVKDQVLTPAQVRRRWRLPRGGHGLRGHRAGTAMAAKSGAQADARR